MTPQLFLTMFTQSSLKSSQFCFVSYNSRLFFLKILFQLWKPSNFTYGSLIILQNSFQLIFNCSNSTIETLEKRCVICSKLTIKTTERCQGSQQFCISVFSEFFLNFYCFQVLFSFSSNKESIYRSSSRDVFLGKGVLNICSKFTGENPCRSVISIKLQSNYIEITLRHGCSPVNLLHNSRTFPKNTYGGLLLHIFPPDDQDF